MDSRAKTYTYLQSRFVSVDPITSQMYTDGPLNGHGMYEVVACSEYFPRKNNTLFYKI